MSPYLLAYGICFGCGTGFTFNPDRVPSYDPSLDDPSKPPGRQPICPSCIQRVNANRRANSLPEWPVYPDSYAALEES